MRLIDADKIDFNEVFIGASEFSKNLIGTAQSLIDSQPTVEAIPKSYADQIRWERDVAIGQLNEIGCQFGQKMDEVREKIEASQWVSCSERLPDIDMSYPNAKDYLVYYEHGYYDVASYSNINRFWHEHTTEPYWNCEQYCKVIAWMPLPEPYKGEQHERIY